MQPNNRYRMNKEMEELERKERWQLASGVAEFAGVVVGVVIVLVLLALLFSLLTWLNQDIRSTFAILMDRF